MKVPRKLLNQYVEVEWLDPVQCTVSAHEMIKGRAQLGVWHERGVLIDITDGILIVEHSHCKTTDDEKLHATWIPEELVSRIRIFTEVVAEAEGTGTLSNI